MENHHHWHIIDALFDGLTKCKYVGILLIFLVSTFVSLQASEASKQTISWKNYFFSKLEKLNKSLNFGTLPIAFMLGWSLYLSVEKNSSFTILEKTVFRSSAVPLSELITSPSSI